jgi:hypothetical protein
MLDEMFGITADPTKDLRNSKDKVSKLKLNHYKNLLEPSNSTVHFSDRRQRTLRHAAWLLTAEKFDSTPGDLFRRWLRYLTWLGHGPWAPNPPVVRVDGTVVASAEEAIKATLLISLNSPPGNPITITFNWSLTNKTDPSNLNVFITRATNPMNITIRSSPEISVTGAVHSDDDDVLV